jgi:hypothetical protein
LVELHAELLHADSCYVDHRFRIRTRSKETDCIDALVTISTIFSPPGPKSCHGGSPTF